MDRALLLTVSDDASAMWGMRFVGRFFRQKTAVRCTILYIAPCGYDCANPDIGPEAHEMQVTLNAHQASKGEEMVATARGWLVEHGFPAENVTTKVLHTQFGVVRDIVNEAHKGLYDAVIVGRRYLDWAEMLYTPSVSRGLLWQSVDVPVWVCNQPELERRNILLCADGSPSASVMADHVGFMMAVEQEHSVTILHLRTADCSEAEAVGEARDRILDNGVDASRISTLVTDAQDKVETIIRLADDGGYAVVAVGRRPDLPEALLPRLFTRSVSLGLHGSVNKFSLWVSR